MARLDGGEKRASVVWDPGSVFFCGKDMHRRGAAGCEGVRLSGNQGRQNPSRAAERDIKEGYKSKVVRRRNGRQLKETEDMGEERTMDGICTSPDRALSRRANGFPVSPGGWLPSVLVLPGAPSPRLSQHWKKAGDTLSSHGTCRGFA